MGVNWHYWRLVGQGQGYCQTSLTGRTAPSQNKDYLAQIFEPPKEQYEPVFHILENWLFKLYSSSSQTLCAYSLTDLNIQQILSPSFILSFELGSRNIVIRKLQEIPAFPGAEVSGLSTEVLGPQKTWRRSRYKSPPCLWEPTLFHSGIGIDIFLCWSRACWASEFSIRTNTTQN